MNSTVTPITPAAAPHSDSLVIGRADSCDFVIADRTVSRRHAALRFADGAWLLADLGSKNGTRVNGVPIAAEAPIEPGDTLGFGAALVRFAPGHRRLLAERAAA
jgi:pSer/pThr/pTyr-binding forkhead associated (FHA) protein